MFDYYDETFDQDLCFKLMTLTYSNEQLKKIRLN
jgi:hypothetical protein